MVWSHLFKEKYLLMADWQKDDRLYLPFPYRPGGRLLRVYWKTQYTQFDINDFVRVSKKLRSNTIDRKVKDILQYNFTGICVTFNLHVQTVHQSFTLRNVFDGFPCEMSFSIHSPLIQDILPLFPQFRAAMKNKHLYLRRWAAVKSERVFSYVAWTTYKRDVEPIPSLA